MSQWTRWTASFVRTLVLGKKGDKINAVAKKPRFVLGDPNRARTQCKLEVKGAS